MSTKKVLNEMVEPGLDGYWCCKICGKDSFVKRSDAKNHVQKFHQGDIQKYKRGY